MLSLDDYNDNMNDLDTKKPIVRNFNYGITFLAEIALEKDIKSAEQDIRQILKNWDEVKNLPNCRNYQYYVKDVDKLKKLVEKVTSIDKNADLNWIDVSSITDMSYLFNGSPFNGDISNWNVSNVTNMHKMFSDSKFDGDISNWDVSKVTDLKFMFYNADFNKDISKWCLNAKADTFLMFKSDAIQDNYKPKK